MQPHGLAYIVSFPTILLVPPVAPLFLWKEIHFLTVIAIKDPPMFSEWDSLVISNINLLLLDLFVWSALEVSKCANFCAYQIAR